MSDSTFLSPIRYFPSDSTFSPIDVTCYYGHNSNNMNKMNETTHQLLKIVLFLYKLISIHYYVHLYL